MPGWLTRPRLLMVLAAVIAVAAGAAGTALALGADGSPEVAVMSRGARTSAELKVASGTTILDITVGRLGGTLLRVSVPDGAPVRPVLACSRLIVLSLDGTAPGGPQSPGQRPGYAVKVVLSSAVTWSLDLAAAPSSPRSTCAAPRSPGSPSWRARTPWT